ncbi:alpha-mannosidase [Paenibacillus brevis]|uniref:Alpha-mannosidase n=1 Tax=Paenibacillus brevis TaxID=2841508 RepID=A0ABS6FQ58_9BACL|nr:alpha-mannosidase [Paenibacillus brevis]MBU5672365.1 alpha-mannosidase [Paenibacillus brevis]
MNRIERLIRHLSELQWKESRTLTGWKVKRGRYILPGQYEWDEDISVEHAGDALDGNAGTTYLLHNQLNIPLEWPSEEIGLRLQSTGEGLLRINGHSYHGLDSNHSFVSINPLKVGYFLELEIELMDPHPNPPDSLNQQFGPQRQPIAAINAQLVQVNRPVRSLIYTLTVAAEAVAQLPEQNLEKGRLMNALYRVYDVFQDLYGNWGEAGVPEAKEIRKLEDELLYALNEDSAGNKAGVMHMVAQSHIDIAWLWPIRETVRKGSRTFSTALRLIEEFPEFHYAQSQPQLYAYVKEHDPELYSRVKEQVAKGRWELVGGMWVEPDLNIPSGESLVRQNLYGQKFYLEEFGKRSFIEWLPDTFGYCASLPQILKLSGVEFFMTSKLNWSDTNHFPYDIFHWVGIDGTSILSYLNHGLGEDTRPKDIKEHWDFFRQKNVHSEEMLLYGHGDGGGGATREMVEYVARSASLPGLPASKFSTAEKYFRGMEASADRFPKWYGDLYLEYHRGTYTTQARNKKMNRKMELLYREAEVWSTLAASLDREDTATEKSLPGLDKGWKLILLNQFHDIIPGSSISEVYETSSNEYTEISKIGNEVLRTGLESLCSKINTLGDGIPYIVFNSLGWERNAVIKLPLEAGTEGMAVDGQGRRLESQITEEAEGRYLLVVHPAVPAFGYTTIWLRTKPLSLSLADKPIASQQPDTDQPLRWETDLYLLEFNKYGEITRWLDKEENRELLKAGVVANELQFFHDLPVEWDAWDLDHRYAEQSAGKAKLESFGIIEAGSVRDVLGLRWSWSHSVIEQKIILQHGLRRVDFKTSVNWQENHKLWKVAFPVDLVSTKATYEIPFGALERSTTNNTSWDQAQYEVCGHRWADLSEGGYGVSLLNDCKYGYDIKEGILRLSLLRAPKWPDEHADLGHHEFTYSVFPHRGNWREAHVVRTAAELNQPVIIEQVGTKTGPQLSEDSFLHLSSNHVVLDTMKLAEDGQGTILRFYESSGAREVIRVQWKCSVERAVLVNLIEEEIEEVLLNNGEIFLDFHPYEIKTIKLIR